MSTATKIALLLIAAACVVALYFTSADIFDPACRGHDVPLRCL